MNFLAHLWLADKSQTSLAGAVLGDVVRGADLSAYPAELALGIRLHRKVDATCDHHPIIVALRESFPPGRRRYAGIVLDLAADHALIARWAGLASEALETFSTRCGLAMAQAAPWFERAGAPVPSASGFSQLLESYGDEAGIDRAIARTASRLRNPQGLIDAGSGWQRCSETLAPQLERLLADLLAAVEAAKNP